VHLVSWSGGKDSCLACHRAIQRGLRVSHLVNTISQEYGRVRFHGTEAKLIQLQAEAMGLPLVQKRTTPDGYEQEFKDAVRSAGLQGTKGMVFGDVYLEEGKKWVERVCRELGIEPFFPLWGEPAAAIPAEFLDAGFQAVVVSARADLFPEEWLGRPVDRAFLRYLEEKGIDACGENGEYHTLVIDGPLFEKRIRLTRTRPIVRDGYRLLDTLEYSL